MQKEEKQIFRDNHKKKTNKEINKIASKANN